MLDEARAILERLPELLREQPQLRYQIQVILAENFVTRDELLKVLEAIEASREEARQRFEAMDRRFEAMDRRFESMDRRFDTLVQELRAQREDFHRQITTLGMRWGIQTEEALRAFARKFIATEFDVQADRWRGPNAELDVVVQNGRCCLIEVTASCNEDKLRRFLANAQAYQLETGRTPTRRIVVTANLSGTDAWNLAQQEGIEIISST